jgi:hypothetical protein
MEEKCIDIYKKKNSSYKQYSKRTAFEVKWE